jgi:RNA polymerase-binding transcription factor DksA
MAPTALRTRDDGQLLDSHDVVRFRETLVSERAAQVALVAEHEAAASDLLGNQDVDSILERELAVAAAARARDAIADIDDALERVADGSFGRCQVCGRPIARPRLDAIPYARRCTACPFARPLLGR